MIVFYTSEYRVIGLKINLKSIRRLLAFMSSRHLRAKHTYMTDTRNSLRDMKLNDLRENKVGSTKFV